MLCNNETISLEQSDFDCVGQIAIHCDLPKLCIAINESRDFDLSNLFCDWSSIADIWEQVQEYQTALAECEADPDCTTPPVEPDDYDTKLALICGGNYTTCSGKVKKHFGVKRLWVYYAYSRYLLINEFNDSPVGNKTKTNDFSLPKSLKEIELFADKYRTMGYDSYKQTEHFICANKTVFESFNLCDCKSCGCGDENCGFTKAKGYGIRGRNISKKI
jgi:hypothetical protein